MPDSNDMPGVAKGWPALLTNLPGIAVLVWLVVVEMPKQRETAAVEIKMLREAFSAELFNQRTACLSELKAVREHDDARTVKLLDVALANQKAIVEIATEIRINRGKGKAE